MTSEALFRTWERECLTEDAPDAVPMIFVAASGGGVRAAYWTALALTNIERQISEAQDVPGGVLADHRHQRGVRWRRWALLSTRRIGLADGPGCRDLRSARVGLARAGGGESGASLTQSGRSSSGTATAKRLETGRTCWSRRCWPTGSRHRPRPDRGPPVRCDDSVRTPCPWRPVCAAHGAWAARCSSSTGPRSARRADTSRRCSTTASPTMRATPAAGNCHQSPDLLEAAEGGTASDDFGPLGATIDLVDSLCVDQDVGLATAALLSARFPFVSPSGRVPACDGDEGRHGEEAFVVDGGYIDNSGAGSLVELWTDLSESGRHPTTRRQTPTPVRASCPSSSRSTTATTSTRRHPPDVPGRCWCRSRRRWAQADRARRSRSSSAPRSSVPPRVLRWPDGHERGRRSRVGSESCPRHTPGCRRRSDGFSPMPRAAISEPRSPTTSRPSAIGPRIDCGPQGETASDLAKFFSANLTCASGGPS